MTALELNGVEGVIDHLYKGHLVRDVDTKKAKYRGEKYKSLDDFKRRKFENLIVIDSELPVIVLYNGSRKHRHNPHIYE